MKIHSVNFLILTLCFVALGLRAQDEKKPLKVISYNIWNGFDFRKDVERKNNVIDWFVDQKPDVVALQELCLLYTSPSPRDGLLSRMPSSA